LNSTSYFLGMSPSFITRKRHQTRDGSLIGGSRLSTATEPVDDDLIAAGEVSARIARAESAKPDRGVLDERVGHAW